MIVKNAYTENGANSATQASFPTKHLYFNDLRCK